MVRRHSSLPSRSKTTSLQRQFCTNKKWTISTSQQYTFKKQTKNFFSVCSFHIWPGEELSLYDAAPQTRMSVYVTAQLTLTANIQLDSRCRHLYTLPRTPSPRSDNVLKSPAAPTYVAPLIVSVSSTGSLHRWRQLCNYYTSGMQWILYSLHVNFSS